MSCTSDARGALWTAAVLAAAATAFAQAPHIGYLYPAGGQRGTVVEIAVGGQNLAGSSGVYISGQGVRGEVVKHTKPLTGQVINDLREMQRGMAELPGLRRMAAADHFETMALHAGLEDPSPKGFAAAQRRLADPKRQPNAQIGETVTVRLTLDADAEPGERELRLRTPSGYTNPLFMQIGQWREHSELEPNDRSADDEVLRVHVEDLDVWVDEQLPVTINGQILPGDMDRFRFKARKGTRLVAVVSARGLIPYLADAVPGWFQATLRLRDAAENELAYSDDFRFDPDPAACCVIPEDGWYTLEIEDAISRGREDFVYRVILGEVPYVTSLFPLGGRVGDRVTVALDGWNLPTNRVTLNLAGRSAGLMSVGVGERDRCSNRLPFKLDALPDFREAEPNDDPRHAQKAAIPLVVNGRMDVPGDRDIFRVKGSAGDEIVAEIQARRLGSPLDSLLTVTDAEGRLLASNDDHDDRGAGLTTHQADSYVTVKLPESGVCLVHVTDTQKKGGAVYGYRLRLGTRRPGFQLRVVPSAVHLQPGATVPVTVYALREDGFSGEIALGLAGMPAGFTLCGTGVPAGQDKVWLTLSASPEAREQRVSLQVEGRAVIGGTECRRPAVPAEDMMQAFAYRHLVPAKDGIVTVAGSRFAGPLGLRLDGPLKLPAGGTVEVGAMVPPVARGGTLRFELGDPPKGIALAGGSTNAAAPTIVLSAAAGDVAAGLKGNLVINALVESVPRDSEGKPTGPARRTPLGVLPAVPFEVVAGAAPPIAATK